MSQPKQPSDPPTVITRNSESYRDTYANSVQVRMSVWDFFLIFRVENFQGIYLSPQQAKALHHLLGHNLAQYEQTFGTLTLEPQFTPPGGPVH
jgi:flagellar protein FlaG